MNMNEKMTSPLLWTAILGAFKLLLDVVGISIPGDKIDSIANGIASVLVVIGIIIDHGQKSVLVTVPVPIAVPVVVDPVVTPPGDPIVIAQ